MKHNHRERSGPEPDRPRRLDPDRQHLRAEIIERLPTTPGGEPSQQAIEVVSGVVGACLEAHRSGRTLTRPDARVLATLLATAVETRKSHLDDFAYGQEVPYQSIRSEYLTLLNRPTLYPEIREAINWLANHLLINQVPELRPSLPPPGEEDWQHEILFNQSLGLTMAVHASGNEGVLQDPVILGRIERFALEHGIAGLAYLRLPTTNAASPDLADKFADAHIGSYDAIVTMLDTLAPFHREGQPDDEAPRYGDLRPEEQARLRRNAGSRWIATEVSGQVHVFRRPPSFSGQMSGIPPDP